MELDLFLSLCSYLGIPMAPERTYGHVTTLSFAGIELDSEAPLSLNFYNAKKSPLRRFSLVQAC